MGKIQGEEKRKRRTEMVDDQHGKGSVHLMRVMSLLQYQRSHLDHLVMKVLLPPLPTSQEQHFRPPKKQPSRGLSVH